MMHPKIPLLVVFVALTPGSLSFAMDRTPWEVADDTPKTPVSSPTHRAPHHAVNIHAITSGGATSTDDDTILHQAALIAKEHPAFNHFDVHDIVKLLKAAQDGPPPSWFSRCWSFCKKEATPPASSRAPLQGQVATIKQLTRQIEGVKARGFHKAPGGAYGEPLPPAAGQSSAGMSEMDPTQLVGAQQMAVANLVMETLQSGRKGDKKKIRTQWGGMGAMVIVMLLSSGTLGGFLGA